MALGFTTHNKFLLEENMLQNFCRTWTTFNFFFYYEISRHLPNRIYLQEAIYTNSIWTEITESSSLVFRLLKIINLIFSNLS